VAGLLSQAERSGSLPRYSASQALQLLHAACLLLPGREPGGQLARSPPVPWAPLTAHVARLARKLALPERRLLSALVGHLQSAPPDHSPGAVGALGAMPSLPVAALPPLRGSCGGERLEWLVVETGAESLLRRARGASQQAACKFLGFGDVLTPVPASGGPPLVSPACLLKVQALRLKGWQVELLA